MRGELGEGRRQVKATALTIDIPETFERFFPYSCQQIDCAPIDLLSVMYSESACRASAINDGPMGAPADKRYNAVGAIQFMPATLYGLGWTQGFEAFRHLDLTGQLPFVVAYFHQWAKQGKPWDSAGRLYQANFVPATLATSHLPEDVLVQRGGRLGWCYEANAVFDADRNGSITIQELTDAIHRNCRGPRWAELCERLDLTPSNTQGGTIESIMDVQVALKALGYDPGNCDGIDGPRTRVAVAAYQTDQKLTVDGIAGPQTRASLAGE